MGNRVLREPTDEEYLELVGLGVLNKMSEVAEWYSEGAHPFIKLTDGEGDAAVLIGEKKQIIVFEITHDLYPDLLVTQLFVAGQIIEVLGSDNLKAYHSGKSPIVQIGYYATFIVGWY